MKNRLETLAYLKAAAIKSLEKPYDIIGITYAWVVKVDMMCAALGIEGIKNGEAYEVDNYMQRIWR
jgi:cytochrome c oxidase assembly protein Cox11